MFLYHLSSQTGIFVSRVRELSAPISSYEFSDPSLPGDLYDTVVWALDIE